MRTSRLLIVLVLALAANSTSLSATKRGSWRAARTGGRSNGTNYEAWPTGQTPPKYTQAGDQISPGIKVDQYSGRDSIVCRSYA